MYLRIDFEKQKVIISAPINAKQSTIDNFIESKIDWINQKLQKIIFNSYKKTKNKFVDGEKIYFKGSIFILENIKTKSNPKIIIKDENIFLYLKENSDIEVKQKILSKFYQQHLLNDAFELIKKYQPIMQVKVNKVSCRFMKTRWGSCNPNLKKINLNLELAKKSTQILELVIVHEMAHLLEANHSKKFYQLMDKFLPNWRNIEANIKNSTY